MKSDIFEYSYQPRIKHRGRVFKEEDHGLTSQEPDIMEPSDDCGLLLLLAACHQLDSYSGKYAFCAPVGDALLRKAGTGRRKARSFFKSEISTDDADATAQQDEHGIVLHHVHADAEEAVDGTCLPVGTAVASGPKRKGRKELHGPCSHCGARCSPQWRKGPKLKPVLCNACGIRFLRTRSLGKVSRGRKRKTRSRDADYAGDDSDNSDFLDVPDAKRSHRSLKAEVQEERSAKMPRVSRPLYSAAIVAGAEQAVGAAAADDSETTSSTSTAEPRLETNHLFCTAHSLHGTQGPAVRNPFVAHKAAAVPSKLGKRSSPNQASHVHLGLQGPVLDLATAGSSSPVLTVAPLVLSMPEGAHSNMMGVTGLDQAGAMPPTWIRRKPSSGPSKALFKKSTY